MRDHRADSVHRTHPSLSLHGIEITGLVGRPMTFSLSVLAEYHDDSLGQRGSSTTALLDLFGEVRLSRRADVLVVTHGVAAASPIAIPVAAAASPDAFVEMSDAGLRLEVPRWSSPGRPVWFLSLRACTFTEFVGCR